METVIKTFIVIMIIIIINITMITHFYLIYNTNQNKNFFIIFEIYILFYTI
jgi:hypothetical protein